MTAVISTILSSPVLVRDTSYVLSTPAPRNGVSAPQPWTITRCQRLLRPLLSHIGRLRREKAREEAASAARQDGVASPGELAAKALRASKREGPDNEQGSRKRIRYTYSLKGTSQRRQHLSDHTESSAKPLRRPKSKQQAYVCPGEVVMSTPLLSRARKHATLSSSPLSAPTAPEATSMENAKVQQQPQLGSCVPFYRGYYHGPSRSGSGRNGGSPMDEEWTRVRKATPQQYHHLYESIFRTVDALLRATKPDPATNATSKTLLAMCLRKMPQYITACEEEEREEAEQQGCTPSTTTAASEIHDDLEALGHGATGWRHLRILARAQGFDILKTAFSEGLLHAAFIQQLVQLCANSQAYKEAEELLSLLVGVETTSYPQPLQGADSTLNKDTGPLASLHLLTKYSDQTSRVSYPLRTITSLLANGRLPAAWLSTQAFSSIWERAIQEISRRRTPAHHVDVIMDFVSTAIGCLAHSESVDDLANVSPSPTSLGSMTSNMDITAASSSSYNTLVSILGSLTAVVILQRESCGDANRGGGGILLAERRLAAIVQTCLGVSRRANKARGRHTSSFKMRTSHVSTKQFLLALAWSLSAYRQHEGADDYDLPLNEPSSRCREMADHETPKQQRQFYDATITLVASVSQNCGRGSEADTSSKSGRAYLWELCQHVARALRPCYATSSEFAFLGRIHSDGAFLLASRTNDLRDLAFAETLREEHQKNKDTRQEDLGLDVGKGSTPISNTASSLNCLNLPPLGHTSTSDPHPALFSGYQWEEGISEWVIANPKSPHHREEGRQNQQVSGRKSDGDDEAGNMAVSESGCVRVTRSMTTRSPSLPVLTIVLPAASPSHIHGDGTWNGRTVTAKTPRAIMVKASPTASNYPLTVSPASSIKRCAGPRNRTKSMLRGRASWPCQGRLSQKQRPETQTLLGFVSDSEESVDEESDGDGSHYDSHGWSEAQDYGDEEYHGGRNSMPCQRGRRPLFQVTHHSVVTTGSKNTIQKHVFGEASDDELGL